MEEKEGFYTLSNSERDRRYKLIRKEMQKRDIDCLIVSGYSSRYNEMNANVRYISNYADNLSGVSYVVFPYDGESTSLVQMSIKRSNAILSWIKDIRSRSTMSASKIFEERIKELGLQESTIGLVGAGFTEGEVIGMPYNVYADMIKKLPKTKFLDATDIFTKLRTIKSREELECIEKSAEICDIAFEEMVKIAKPNIEEREWFADIHRVIYAHGGENPSFWIGASGPLPTKNPELFKNDPLASSRIINKGDVIISEIGPKIAGYIAQSLQLISIGEPHKDVRLIAKHSLEIYEKVAKELEPGKKVGDILNIVEDMKRKAKNELGDYTQSLTTIIHPIGLGQPDSTVVPSQELELKPGMAVMVEIGPPAQKAVFSWIGTAFEITNTGSKSLTKIPFNERALSVT